MARMDIRWARWPGILLLALLFSRPVAAQPPDTVVVQWDNAILQAIRDTKPGPPMVARDLAIVHTAMFDAWAAYDPVAVGTRLGGLLRRPASEATAANKTEAISYAAYRALVDLFPQPSETPKFTALLTGLGYNPDNTTTDLSTAAGIGNEAAAALLEFRHHDGSNQLGDLHPGAYSDYTGFLPFNTVSRLYDPNSWQPLRIPTGFATYQVQSFIGAQWGSVIPFALASPSQLLPPPPFRYPSPQYVQQAMDLVRISATLTDEQKASAEYWADGPSSEFPPGHWCLFGQYCSRRDQHTLDADVKMFFILSNAEFDAGIAAWDAKRSYDSVRPITAIHFLFGGKRVRAWAGPYLSTRLIDGSRWQPYQQLTVVTPAFPEYVSGHSAFSAAGAEILKRFTGSDYLGAAFVVRARSSRVEPGMTPHQDVVFYWSTFSAAADAAGMSRRYGGIHFENGDLTGRALGRRVGAIVWNKAQTYINGTAFGRY